MAATRSGIVEETTVETEPMMVTEKEIADELVAEALRLQELLNTPPRLEDTMESFFSLSAGPLRVQPGELLGSAAGRSSDLALPPGGRRPLKSQRHGFHRHVAPQPSAHLATTEELESRVALLREEVKTLSSQNAALKEQAGCFIAGASRGGRPGENRSDPREALRAELRILREEKQRLVEDIQRVEKKLAETESRFRKLLPTRSGFRERTTTGEGRPEEPLEPAGELLIGTPRPKPNKVEEYRELIEQLQWERHLMSQEHQKVCRKFARRVNGYFHLERKLATGLQKLSFLVLRQQAEIRHLLAVLPPSEREQVQLFMGQRAQPSLGLQQPDRPGENESPRRADG